MRTTNATALRALALAVARETPGCGKVSSVSRDLLDLCDVVARDAVMATLRRAARQHRTAGKRLLPPVWT